jgi:hypothetical protein
LPLSSSTPILYRASNTSFPFAGTTGFIQKFQKQLFKQKSSTTSIRNMDDRPDGPEPVTVEATTDNVVFDDDEEEDEDECRVCRGPAEEG